MNERVIVASLADIGTAQVALRVCQFFRNQLPDAGAACAHHDKPQRHVDLLCKLAGEVPAHRGKLQRCLAPGALPAPRRIDDVELRLLAVHLVGGNKRLRLREQPEVVLLGELHAGRHRHAGRQRQLRVGLPADQPYVADQDVFQYRLMPRLVPDDHTLRLAGICVRGESQRPPAIGGCRLGHGGTHSLPHKFACHSRAGVTGEAPDANRLVALKHHM